MCIRVTGVRTLYTKEGVAYIEFARPLRPSVMQGLKYIKIGVTGNALIKCHEDY